MSEFSENVLIHKLRKLSLYGICSNYKIETLKPNQLVNILYYLSIKWNSSFESQNIEKTKEKYSCVKKTLREMNCSHLILKIEDLKSVNTNSRAKKRIIQVLLTMLNKLETRFINLDRRTNRNKAKGQIKKVKPMFCMKKNMLSIKKNETKKEKLRLKHGRKINKSNVFKRKILYFQKKVSFFKTNFTSLDRNSWNGIEDFLSTIVDDPVIRRKNILTKKKQVIKTNFIQMFEIIGTSSFLFTRSQREQFRKIFNLTFGRLHSYKIQSISHSTRLLWTTNCLISRNLRDRIRFHIQFTVTKIKACIIPEHDPVVKNTLEKTKCNLIITDVEL